MAATKGKLTKHQQEQTRQAIKTTQLVKRLQFYALGELDDAGNKVELDPQQIRSIEILLKKTLPDQQAVKVSGDEDNPVTHVFRTFYEPKPNE
jgi:hypothetical protein